MSPLQSHRLVIAIALLVFAAVRPSSAWAQLGGISGKATHKLTGAPIEGIVVSIYTPEGLRTATTATDGTYTIAALPSRFYRVTAGLQPYLPESYPTPVAVLPGATTTGIDFAFALAASISGRITNAATGQPIGGIIVRATGPSFSSASTDLDGRYSIGQIRAGSYYVRTEQSTGFVDYQYPNVPCDPACPETSGVSVTVQPEATTPNIDIALAALPANGHISGRVVSSATGDPIAQVTIEAYDASLNGVGLSLSDYQGLYSVTVPPGTIYLRANPMNPGARYAPEVYDDVPCLPSCNVANGTGIAVAAGGTVADIDFALLPGAFINGTVTDAVSGALLGGVRIEAFSPNSTVPAASVTTDLTGAFSIPVLPGLYFVRTSHIGVATHANKLYPSTTCLEACPLVGGTAVSVGTNGQTVSNIDMALAPLATITGIVTNESTGVPLSAATVSIHALNGSLVRGAFTGMSGEYSLRVLPGNYYLKADGPPPFRDEVYNNLPCMGACVVTTGTPVAAALGAPSTIHFALVPGGAIAGKVLVAGTGNALIESARIDVYNAAGEFVVFTYAQSDGSYFILVPAGQYRVHVATLSHWIGEAFDNVPCPLTCSPTTGALVTVAPNGTTSGIDFALDHGGVITGYVADEVSGMPLAGVAVHAYTLDGQLVRSAGPSFTLGLPPGLYTLQTVSQQEANRQDELYNNIPCEPSCDVRRGTPIEITPQTFLQNFVLSLAPGGMLTGRVSEAGTGAGLEGIVVEITTVPGVSLGTVQTGDNGIYTFSGLSTGAYRVRTLNAWLSNYVDELYGGSPCVGCNVVGGGLVSVGSGQVTSNIDIQLSHGGGFEGAITSAPDGVLLNGVPVRIYDATGFVRTVYSVGNGYRASGLPPGTYWARTASTAGWINQWYGGVVCTDACEVPAGSPIVVSGVNTTSGVNFGLIHGGSIGGRVVDGATSYAIPQVGGAVTVRAYRSTGAFVAEASLTPEGAYEFTGLPTGAYYLRTANTLGYVDRLYGGAACLLTCNPLDAIPLLVSGADAVAAANMVLSPGGRIAGRVTAVGSAAPLGDVAVRLYAPSGAWVAEGRSGSDGAFITTSGVPAGLYYARTAAAGGFADQIYAGQELCAVSCLVTSGTAVAVQDGATTPNIDFALTPVTELIRNGTFIDAEAYWSAFGTPTMSHVMWSIPAGIMQFARLAAQNGDATQAVIFQATGASFTANTVLSAGFDLGNTSAVRRRISVVVHDADFSDLAVCTFWLPPQLPLTRFGMRTRANEAWTNATISFYAATVNGPPGVYLLDNVSMHQTAPSTEARVDCLDATVPGTSPGSLGPDLLVNGAFAADNLSPGWATFGQIDAHVQAQVAEFVRPSGAPAGVLFQQTGQVAAAGDRLIANFDLGNSSAVRKRVTVVLHDKDFSDLAACTFWLPPGQPLEGYVLRAVTTEAWTDTTLSFYVATVGLEGWVRLDNVTLRRAPGTQVAGTECLEPGTDAGQSSSARMFASAGYRGEPERLVAPTAATLPSGLQPVVASSPFGNEAGIGDGPPSIWVAEGFTREPGGSWVADDLGTDRAHTLTLAAPLNLTGPRTASLHFQSQHVLPRPTSVQVSVDDGPWETAMLVRPADGVVPIEVDLTPYRGARVRVRLLLVESSALVPGSGQWRTSDLEIDVTEPGSDLLP